MTKLFLPIKSQEGSISQSENLDKLFLATGFGRVPFYLFIDTESGEKKWVRNENHHYGGKINPWNKAIDLNTEVVIAPHLGSSPFNGLNKGGVNIFKGNSTEPVSKIIEAFKNGKLTELEKPPKGTSCSGGTHDHDH